jgi:hypothetical protein
LSSTWDGCGDKQFLSAICRTLLQSAKSRELNAPVPEAGNNVASGEFNNLTLFPPCFSLFSFFFFFNVYFVKSTL